MSEVCRGMQPVCAAWPTALPTGHAPLAKQACRGWQRALRCRLLHGASSSFWGVYTSAYLPVGCLGRTVPAVDVVYYCYMHNCWLLPAAAVLWGPSRRWAFSSLVVLQ